MGVVSSPLEKGGWNGKFQIKLTDGWADGWLDRWMDVSRCILT